MGLFGGEAQDRTGEITKTKVYDVKPITLEDAQLKLQDKNIRYNNNISQEELAKMLEINRNYLSRIETNKSLPTAEILAKLALTFNISIDSLLGVNLDKNDGVEIRKEKINKINQYLMYLSNSELDFVVNMLCVMTNNTRKKN